LLTYYITQNFSRELEKTDLAHWIRKLDAKESGKNLKENTLSVIVQENLAHACEKEVY
jgi:hypothetical protein